MFIRDRNYTFVMQSVLNLSEENPAFKEKALSLLLTLPDTDVKTALVAYLNYVVDRDK